MLCMSVKKRIIFEFLEYVQHSAAAALLCVVPTYIYFRSVFLIFLNNSRKFNAFFALTTLCLLLVDGGVCPE